jgi:hypothetical protein
MYHDTFEVLAYDSYILAMKGMAITGLPRDGLMV